MSYHGIGATRTPLATRSTGLDLTKRGTTAPVTALIATPTSSPSTSSKWLVGWNIGWLIGCVGLGVVGYLVLRKKKKKK